MNHHIFISMFIISIEHALSTIQSQSCRSCDALHKCEVVLSVGVHPWNAEGSVLDCNGHEVECKRKSDGTLFWTPFDPCKEGLRTYEPTKATTTNLPLVSNLIPSGMLLPENSDELTSTISSSESSSTSPLNETTFSRHDPERKTGWLITKSHLKIILWILFPIAIILLFTGLAGLVFLLLYQRRRKGKLDVRPYESNHIDGYQSARTYGIIAYEPTSHTGLGYEKLRNKTHYWVQRNASVRNGAVGNMLATHSDAFTPNSSIRRYRSVFQRSREQLDHTTACPQETGLNAEFRVDYPPPHNAFQLITFGSNGGPQEDIYKNATPPGLKDFTEEITYPPDPELNGMVIHLSRCPSEATEEDPQLSYSQDNGFRNLQSYTTDFEGSDIFLSSFRSPDNFARDPVHQKRSVA